jgi:hypothetical protein
MTGLFDLEYHENKIREYQSPLAKSHRVINWKLFREPKGSDGRSPYDKITLC